MNIEVIERWSEDDDSIGLKFFLPNGGMSAVLYPKEKTIELYEALLNAADYMKKRMVETNTSTTNEV